MKIIRRSFDSLPRFQFFIFWIFVSFFVITSLLAGVVSEQMAHSEAERETRPGGGDRKGDSWGDGEDHCCIDHLARHYDM